MTGTGSSLLDTLPCGILTVGDDGHVERVNRPLLDMLGVARGDVEGRHVEALFTTGTRIFYQTHFYPLVKLHGHAEEIYLELVDRSGAPVGVLANAVRLEGEGRPVIHCVLVRVRRRKQFEEELLRARKAAEEALGEAAAARREAESANAAKSTFLATMSHEIRTPINAILGYADLLEMEVTGPLTDEQRSYVNRVRSGGHHLLTVINDVLDMSRIESGGMTVERREARLEDAVAEALDMVEPLARERGIETRWVSRSQVAPYVGDPDRVRQILINLVSNATKFTDEGGRVTVEHGTVERADPDAHLEGSGPWGYARVRDTGIGIAVEELEGIFEPFRQVGPVAGGSGLGLTISRRLARAMDGDLTVDSSLGEGSCFTLWLPAGTTAATGPAESEALRR